MNIYEMIHQIKCNNSKDIALRIVGELTSGVKDNFKLGQLCVLWSTSTNQSAYSFREVAIKHLNTNFRKNY